MLSLRAALLAGVCLAAVGANSAAWQEGASPDARTAEALAAADGDARTQLLATLAPANIPGVCAALNVISERQRTRGELTQAVATSRLALDLARRDGSDTLLVRASNTLGAALTSRGDLREAFDVLTRARDLSKSTGDAPAYAESLGRISYIYFAQGKPAEALAAGEESLALRREQGNPVEIAAALNYVGMAERQRGDFDRALAHYEEAVALSERAGADDQLARTLNNMAVADRERGNNERAIESYRRSLAIAERLGNRSAVSNTLSNLGMSYGDQGLNDLALDHYLRSLAISEEIGDRRNIAATLGSVGFLYRVQGNTALAMEYYRRSLEYNEAIGNREGVSRILMFQARIDAERGDYQAAGARFERALELRRAMRDRAGEANIVLDLGRMADQQGDSDQALRRYQEGLALIEQSGERRSLSYALLRVAGMHNKRGEYRQALDAATRALTVLEETGQQARYWATQLAIGRAHRGLGEPAAARQAFEQAIESVESLRTQAAGGDEDRQRAFEQQIDPYREMVALLAGEDRAAEALTYAERAKGRMLIDVLRQGRVNITKAMTTAEQEEEHALNQDLVVAATALQRERQQPAPDAGRIDVTRRGLDAARARADAFRIALYSRYPHLKVQRSETPAVTRAELAPLVGDGRTALLEFVVTRTVTWLFVATRGSAQESVRLAVHRIDIGGDALERQVEAYRSAVGSRNLGFRGEGRALFDRLLAPAATALAGRTRLVLVPDGPLWDLPFQALVTPDGAFLVEHRTVSYAPSLTVLREMGLSRGAEAPRGRAAVAFGNPSPGRPLPSAGDGGLRSSDFVPLPSAEAEARALIRLYGTGSEVHVGSDASEGRLKRDARAFSVVHLATHGVLNNADPMSSHLLLAPSSSDGVSEDGRLQAREILSLDLRAQLAVLSGCDTARGRVGAGEGVIGLTWALFVAGVPTTVVSQWQVDSESTSRLMVGLHRRLAASPSLSPAEALGESARALMANPKYRHPFYWAGFVVIGDGLRPSPIGTH